MHAACLFLLNYFYMPDSASGRTIRETDLDIDGIVSGCAKEIGWYREVESTMRVRSDCLVEELIGDDDYVTTLVVQRLVWSQQQTLCRPEDR